MSGVFIFKMQQYSAVKTEIKKGKPIEEIEGADSILNTIEDFYTETEGGEG